MARQARSTRSGSRSLSFFQELLKNPKKPFALALLFADASLVCLIITYVPYTKIDWDAYMSQVSGFLGGERDYSKLKGDTGPLVYPAGFLYLYSAIQYVTGGEVYPAQVPSWALCLVSLSKRVHSIFLLRLFNDCFATTFFHAALLLFLHQKWHLGLIIFSGAVSVKMNVLLFAPPLLLLLVKAMDTYGVILALAGAALVQVFLGLPFLLSYPIEYISRAFNLGRVFIHFWSVNFKFLPEPIFVSKGFALLLLAAHLILLAIFAHYRWCRHEGGLFSLLRSHVARTKLGNAYLSSFPLKQLNYSNSNSRILKPEHIATTLFVGNFIGIVCARSLHYQFYSWYFYSLPYLLWRTPFPTWLRLILFVMVELCWNVYPCNSYSSLLLFVVHLIILGGLWRAPTNYPYADDRNVKFEKLK